MYSLWFGNQKIHDIDQLKDNFDFDAAEIYLLGGGLSRWLRNCGEIETADRVDKIDLHEDISKQLSEIFSVKQPKYSDASPALANVKNIFPAKKIGVLLPYYEYRSFNADFPQKSIPLSAEPGKKLNSFVLNTDSFGAHANFAPAQSSFESSSFNLTIGSFYHNSSSFSLFTSSFSEIYSSFSLFGGSFETVSFNNLSVLNSSYNFNSFSYGSFNLSEFEYEYGTSFNTSSFNGSFDINAVKSDASDKTEDHKKSCHVHITQLSPEEKIKLNIGLCPLNRFGYGINLV